MEWNLLTLDQTPALSTSLNTISKTLESMQISGTTSVWAAIRSDARLYRQLRFPQGGPWSMFRVWTSSPGLFVLAVHRAHHYLIERQQTHGWSMGLVVLKVLVNIGVQLSVLIGKAEFECNAEIGAPVYVSDRGHLVIGPRSIGKGSVIHHRVTIGMDLVDMGTVRVGENVWIGPDSVLYGDIQIGDGSTVLPGTVLSRSIPPRTVVGGNPARILKHDFDNRILRASLVADVDADSLASS